MRKKIRILIYSLVIMGALLTLANSCNNNPTNNNPTQGSGSTVTDIDGNVYHTVSIGTQVWMVENLKTTKFRDGTPITNVSDSSAWINLKTGAYCNFNNNANNSVTYGRLYNWYAVQGSRNIAPKGWHVPSNAEWTTLITYLGGERVAGSLLKEAGTTHWASPNAGAMNVSRFTALPGGYRLRDGSFGNIARYGDWWSSTEDGMDNAWFAVLNYNLGGVYRDFNSKNLGFSVRCVKD